MSAMTNIFDNQYSLDKSRLFTDVVCKLRNEVYPKEISIIQSSIIDRCTDIESIEIPDGNTIIILNPKNKKKAIDISIVYDTMYNILSDIYQRNIINIYGKTHEYSNIDINMLFNIISYGERIKILL